MRKIEALSKAVKTFEKSTKPKSISDALHIFNFTLEQELIDLMQQDTAIGKLAKRAWLIVKDWLQKNSTYVNSYQLKHMDELETTFLKQVAKTDHTIFLKVIPEGKNGDDNKWIITDPAYYIEDGLIYYKLN
jgi:hypothetical protein